MHRLAHKLFPSPSFDETHHYSFQKALIKNTGPVYLSVKLVCFHITKDTCANYSTIPSSVCARFWKHMSVKEFYMERITIVRTSLLRILLYFTNFYFYLFIFSIFVCNFWTVGFWWVVAMKFLILMTRAFQRYHFFQSMTLTSGCSLVSLFRNNIMIVLLMYFEILKYIY